MAEISREERMVKTISDAVNNFGFDVDKFLNAMGREHRYLQNLFFLDIVCEFIRYAGSDDYGYDGRNEYTHEMCKRLIPVLNEGVR